MLLGDGLSQKKRVHHHGTNGLISGIIDRTAIFCRQLYVVLGALTPMGGNVGKRSFHVISSFLPTFGHEKKQPLRAAIIMVILHGVVVIYGGHGVEQGRQQVGFGVPYLSAVIRNALQHTLYVRGGDFLEPLLDILGGILCIPTDTDGFAAIHSNLQHNFQQFVHLFLPELFPQPILFYLMLDALSHIPYFRLSFCWGIGRKE